MAVISILSNGSTQGHKPLKNVLDYCMQEAKTMNDGHKLVSGIDCLPETAYSDMMATKKRFGKTGGREYYHILQSFSPEELITPEEAHRIACEYAQEQFKGYELIVATHVDRDHIHSHIVLNSVSYIDGKKYHSDKNNIPRLREASDALCMKHGLSVIGKTENGLRKMGTREYRAASKGESWKINLMATINLAMTKAKTRNDFIRFMESRGYKVTWSDTRKYITYTIPDGKKCRDNKLHLKKYTKEMMDYEFEIRRRINELHRQRREESYTGSRTDEVRDDLGRELGEHRQDVGSAVKSDGQARSNNEGTAFNRSVNELHSANYGYKPDTSKEMDDRSGRILDQDYDGSDLTGWENERAICYGSGQGQEGNTGLFGQTVSPSASSLPSYDVALSGAYLVAGASTLIESPQDEDHDENEIAREKASHEDKKKKQKNGQGPVITM
jgi:hypothetical protein